MTKLQRTYNRFNRLYFGGKLPSDIDIRWHRYTKESKICGESDSEVIWVNEAHKAWPKVWQITLLHEMAHVATVNERAHHGVKWVKEMRRLMREGAFDGLL
jgi:hypothetical protein